MDKCIFKMSVKEVATEVFREYMPTEASRKTDEIISEGTVLGRDGADTVVFVEYGRLNGLFLLMELNPADMCDETLADVLYKYGRAQTIKTSMYVPLSDLCFCSRLGTMHLKTKVPVGGRATVGTRTDVTQSYMSLWELHSLLKGKICLRGDEERLLCGLRWDSEDIEEMLQYDGIVIGETSGGALSVTEGYEALYNGWYLAGLLPSDTIGGIPGGIPSGYTLDGSFGSDILVTRVKEGSTKIYLFR